MNPKTRPRYFIATTFLLLLCFCALLAVSPAQTPYEILGVGRNASLGEIRKAYYRLASKYHPDTGGESADVERFKLVQEAYDSLSDPSWKATYDHTTFGASLRSEPFAQRDPDFYSFHGFNYSVPEMPEGTRKSFYHGWVLHDPDTDQDVPLDSRTGFPKDFHYNPGTSSDTSAFFDELLNPRNLGRRRPWVERAMKLPWTDAQKKDFRARAREVLRAATTTEMFPSRENYLRMHTVFDLPFILEFPELVFEFLESHPRYKGVFQQSYLAHPHWSSSPHFAKLFDLTADTADGRDLFVTIVGPMDIRPGDPTGETKISRFDGKPYVVHRVLKSREIRYDVFKRWAPFIIPKLTPQEIPRVVEALILFEGEGLASVLAELQLLRASSAFQQAVRTNQTPRFLVALQRFNEKTGQKKLPGAGGGLQASAPSSSTTTDSTRLQRSKRCGFERLSDSAPSTKAPGRKK